MSLLESAFLDGALKVTHLELQRPPVSQGLGPFRVEDERGEFAAFLRGRQVEFGEVVELRAGAVRGRHYHQLASEIVYVISGSILGKFGIRDQAPIEEIDLPPGSLIEIAPGISHSLKAAERSFVVSMASNSDPLADRYPAADPKW